MIQVCRVQKKTKQKAFNRPKHAKKHLQQNQNKTKKDKKKERKSRVWRNEHRPKAINYSHDDNNNKYI